MSDNPKMSFAEIKALCKKNPNRRIICRREDAFPPFSDVFIWIEDPECFLHDHTGIGCRRRIHVSGFYREGGYMDNSIRECAEKAFPSDTVFELLRAENVRM